MWALGGENPAVEPAGAIGLDAVIDLSLFSRANLLLGGSPTQVPDRCVAAAPVLDADRVRLIHGAEDRIVRPETLRSAELAGVPIAMTDATDHFDVIDPDAAAWSAVLDGLTVLLGRAQGAHD